MKYFTKTNTMNIKIRGVAFVAYLCRTGASSFPHVNFPLTTVTANSVEQQNDKSEKKNPSHPSAGQGGVTR